MNNYQVTSMRNVLAGFLAAAVLALFGVGQVNAQAFTDQADITGTIEVVEALTLSSDQATVDFGSQLPGANVTVPAGQSASVGENSSGASLTVEGADGATVEVAWSQPPNFLGDWGWNPIVSQSSGGSSIGNGSSITLDGGSQNLFLGGSTTVPDNVSNTVESSTFALTVTYTSL